MQVGNYLNYSYDSIEIECPIQNAADVINICFKTLDDWPVENFDFLELPIGCDGDVGISWGETRKVKPGITQAQVYEIINTVTAKSIETFGSLLP